MCAGRPGIEGWCRAHSPIAKADLVPTDTNLRDTYGSWAELVDACDAFMVKVNEREHRITRRAPVEMLAEEQHRLHRLPDVVFTAAFGETRSVSRTATFSFGGVTYSVPHTLIDQVVWVRVDGDEIVVTHMAALGAVEVSRHSGPRQATRSWVDAHYQPQPAGALAREPRPGNAAEVEFLALGDGARMWLVEAAAAGASRVKVKMAEAVQLALLHGVSRVDWALGHAASFERFGDGDLASILAAHPVGQQRRADDVHSMQPSTRAWESFGEVAS